VAQIQDIIVGSGGAAGILARALAGAGRSVAVLESGPSGVDPGFGWGEADVHSQLMQSGGRVGTRDGSTSIQQGRCIGGSTTVGDGIADSFAPGVIDAWRSRGLGGVDRLTDAADAVLRTLGAAPDPADERAGIDALLASATPRAGRWRGRVAGTRSDEDGQLGGPTAGDLEQARLAGAELVFSAAAEGFHMKGDRALSIRGPGLEREAERFILCAGALGTPALLRRSKLIDGDELSGLVLPRRLLVLARFEQPVRKGARPGSWVFDERLRLAGDGPDGFAIEGASIGPATAAALSGLPIPVVRDVLRSWDRVEAAWCVVPEAASLRFDRRGAAFAGRVDSSSARERTLQGLTLTVETLLAAGARDVFIPVGDGQPIRRASDLSALDADASDAPAACIAPQGGCADLVDEIGRVRGTDNVYVCDTSVFPTAAGLTPMVPTMALGQVRARDLLA